MSNATVFGDLPPLPSFNLVPRQPLLPPLPDKYLSLLLPIVAYWVFSMVFHLIDEYDLFPQYRLHTPIEVLRRNRVSRWEVVRDVVVQQVIQTIVGCGLAMLEENEFEGKNDYHVAVWAQRVRLAQRLIPQVLAMSGVDAKALAQKVFTTSPAVAGALGGGSYPWLATMQDGIAIPSYAAWEIIAAKALYWVIVPAFQFGLAIVIVDTWQYFLHRAMHMNKWLYTTFHARHHRLYVPYAYGALYNHPFEGFLLDTVGTCVAYLVAGLTPRQGMCFFTGSTIKTVDDHCGYALPWDPLQHITSNNAGYHDVHHQSWGIKTNFSQPFLTFWDKALGTVWTGGDVSTRYERARLAAEKKDTNEKNGRRRASSITGSNPIDSILDSDAPYQKDAQEASQLSQSAHANLSPTIPPGKATAQALGSREQILQDHVGGGPAIFAEEAIEEVEARKFVSRSPRKRTGPSSPAAQAGSLKGLRDRVTTGGTFHGRTGGILGYESSI